MVDDDGRVFCVVLGRPKGWKERSARVRTAIKRLIEKVGYGTGINRRGGFGSYTTGFSFGGGRQVRAPHYVVDLVIDALEYQSGTDELRT